jgi:phosphoserine phosphatase
LKKLTYQPNYCRDGANDLPMLNLAGLGIAFHANGERKRFSSISSLGLDGVLYLLGHDRHIDMMEELP